MTAIIRPRQPSTLESKAAYELCNTIEDYLLTGNARLAIMPPLVQEILTKNVVEFNFACWFGAYVECYIDEKDSFYDVLEVNLAIHYQQPQPYTGSALSITLRKRKKEYVHKFQTRDVVAKTITGERGDTLARWLYYLPDPAQSLAECVSRGRLIEYMRFLPDIYIPHFLPTSPPYHFVVKKPINCEYYTAAHYIWDGSGAGIKHGRRIRYDGKVVEEDNWQTGRLHGAFMRWKNGTLRQIARFVRGKANGRTRSWDKQGQMTVDKHYKDDIFRGLFVLHHDGQIAMMNYHTKRNTIKFYEYGIRLNSCNQVQTILNTKQILRIPREYWLLLNLSD